MFTIEFPLDPEIESVHIWMWISAMKIPFECDGMYNDGKQCSQLDDVIKWKHFPRHWLFVQGIHRSLVNSPHKGQWRGALMFSLICAIINGWVNNREDGDLRCHRAHCDVTVMSCTRFPMGVSNWAYLQGYPTGTGTAMRLACTNSIEAILTNTGLILGLRPANERGSYFVKASLIGWVQA